jgi:hypothetical protein
MSNEASLPLNNEAPAKRFDWLAALALGLALFVMVLPFEAGILTGFFISRRLFDAAFLAISCFAIVGLPALVSWRRHRKNPGLYRGKWQLATTAVILALNLLMVASGFLKQLRM